jgi:hypothetical protein
MDGDLRKLHVVQRDSRYLAALLIALLALILRWRAVVMLPVDYDEPIYMDAAARYAAAIRARDWNQVPSIRHTIEHPAVVKVVYALGILIWPSGGGEALASPERAGPLDSATALVQSSDQYVPVGRAISLLLGVLQVALLALWSPVAGLFLAIHTTAIKYTSQACLEALPSFASLLSVTAYVRCARQQKPVSGWLALSAVAIGVTAASKYTYLVAALAVIPLIAWHTRTRLWVLTLFLAIALFTFFLLDIELWADPFGRLRDSLLFHPAFSQSLPVQQMNLPWWQPLQYLSRALPWHPGVFVVGWDTAIFVLAVLGFAFLARRRPVAALWLAVGIVALLAWPTKWPQYTLIVLAPLCLSAGMAVSAAGQWLRQHTEVFSPLRVYAPDRATAVVLASVGLALLLGFSYVQWQSSRQTQGWTVYNTRNSGLPSDSVRALAIDRQGRVWAGTDQGAALLQDGAWITYTARNSGLVSNSVRAVAVDDAGRAWFGTDEGVSVTDGRSWHSYTSSDSGLLHDRVLCLAPLPSLSTFTFSPIWIGTEKGLSYFDGSTWRGYTPENSAIAGARVLSLAIGQDGRVWCGTWGGLSVFDGRDWISYTTRNSGLAYDTVSSVAIDSEGLVWCGTLNGVNSFDGQAWRTYDIANMSLRFNTATAVAADRRGSIWVGGDLPYGPLGAAATYDGQGWRDFSQFFSGLRQAPVRTIVADADGKVWFATLLEGILVFDGR